MKIKFKIFKNDGEYDYEYGENSDGEYEYEYGDNSDGTNPYSYSYSYPTLVVALKTSLLQPHTIHTGVHHLPL